MQNESAQADAPPDEARTCELAGTSLRWGIASLLSPFAGGMAAAIAEREGVRCTPVLVAIGLGTALVCIVPAVASGHAALGRISRAGGTLRGRGRAVAGTVLGYAGLILAGSGALFGVWALERVDLAVCAANLRAIGTLCHNYASEHGGRLPGNLSRLQQTSGWDPAAFVCPSTDDATPTPGRIDEEGSYVYAGAGHRTDAGDPSTTPIVWDRPGNHGAEGVNVLYLDGHTEWRREPPTPVPPPGY